MMKRLFEESMHRMQPSRFNVEYMFECVFFSDPRR